MKRQEPSGFGIKKYDDKNCPGLKTDLEIAPLLISSAILLFKLTKFVGLLGNFI